MIDSSNYNIFYDIHPDVCAATIGRDEDLPCHILQMHQVHDVRVAVVDREDMTREELDDMMP